MVRRRNNNRKLMSRRPPLRPQEVFFLLDDDDDESDSDLQIRTEEEEESSYNEDGFIPPGVTAIFNEVTTKVTTLLPFMTIMILKNLIDYGSGILCFLLLFLVFCLGDSYLTQEIGRQEERSRFILAIIVATLHGSAALSFHVFAEEELPYALGFMATKVELTNFLKLMWVVGVSDVVVKFVTIVVKALVVAMSPELIPFQRRGTLYLFIERTSQLYRSLLPARQWVLYLTTSYEGGSIGVLLAVVYGILKVFDSIQRVEDWLGAFGQLFQGVTYGARMTKKEVKKLDSRICPICADTLVFPTRLLCSHVFCDRCISSWFDRGMTCPICRAEVTEDPSFRDGTTSYYVQLF